VTYGSVFNYLMAGSKPGAPEVGMGATILMYSDRHAATIVEVGTNKAGEVNKIVVTRDHYRRTDSLGMTDSGQEYEFTPNPDGAKVTYTKRRNGQFIEQGSPMRGGGGILIGHRDHYYDFTR
jgi:hypothetical protein